MNKRGINYDRNSVDIKDTKISETESDGIAVDSRYSQDDVREGMEDEHIQKKEKAGKDKVLRVLDIYKKLMDGELINKAQEAHNYNVAERSIRRDIDDIKSFMAQESDKTGVIRTVDYDYQDKGYRLREVYKTKLSNSEILAICKIHLDSRAFTKEEMTSILQRLIECCVPDKSRQIVSNLIKNETYHYVELTHKSVFIDKMWDIGTAIQNYNYIEMNYHRSKDNAIVKRKVKPVAIMFSEYYFYLTAFIDDEEVRADFDVLNDSFPTIYRIDRIESYKVLSEKFRIPYTDRFEEGEFRKRIQFMMGGRLQKVKFKYKGSSVEAVLDRLPTARIIDEEDGAYIISAEVFGKGINMWLRSQGDMVEVMEER